MHLCSVTVVAEKLSNVCIYVTKTYDMTLCLKAEVNASNIATD